MLDFSWLPPPLADLLPRILKAIKARLKLDYLTIGLPAVVLICGAIGYWRVEYPGIEHKDASGVLHVVVAVVYDVLGSFKTSFKAKDPHNTLTDLAALAGALFLYSWFVALLFTIFRETGEKALARVWAPHVVLIGDTPLMARIDKIWRAKGRHPLAVVSCNAAQPHDWASRRVRHTFDETLVRAFAVHKAEHVVIDLGDDMQTLTLAFQLLSAAVARQGRHPDCEWIFVMRNASLADHFANKVRDLVPAGAALPLPRLHYLDTERLAARFFLASHPLFRLAEARGQRRVHALLVGNAPVCRHLIEMILLATPTADLERPIITVLTSHADAEKRAFFSGRPALMEAVDVAFIDADALDGFERHDGAAAELLDAREAQTPITVAFLVSENAQENIASALLLNRIQRKTSRLRCPVFSYEKDAAEAEFLAASEKFSKAIGGFEVFGLPDDYLTQQVCDADTRDLLAKALHARYLRRAGKPGMTWNELTESMRRANRNAADHWRAKMHMLGFDIDDIPAATLAKLTPEEADAVMKQPAAAAADGSASPLAAAVRCEHDRWMVERHLDGWAYGAKRDDDRQIHNLLVSWEVLERDFPGEIVKDADQIEGTVECLVTCGDPAFVLKRRATEAAPMDAA